MGDVAYLYLTHRQGEASRSRRSAWVGFPTAGLDLLNGSLPWNRLLPPLRLGSIPPMAGSGPGMAVVLPLNPVDLARGCDFARTRFTMALDLARRLGVRTVALDGRLIGPSWTALTAREGRFRVVTGESLEIIGAVAALETLAGHDFRGWRVGVAVGSNNRSAAQTLAMWLARRVRRVALFGPRREALARVAARVMADSGLVAEVVVTPAGGIEPMEAIFMPRAIRPAPDGAVDGRTIIVHLPSWNADGMDEDSEKGIQGRRATAGMVRVPWPGPCPRRLARLFPPATASGGGGARLLPPAAVEAILETDEDPPGPARPSLRRVERLARLIRRHALSFEELRWLDAEGPGRHREGKN